jgi:P-type Cu+ transporter
MNDTRTLPRQSESPTGERFVEFAVPGMGSDHCAGIISTSLKRVDGIQSVQTSVASHKVTVRFDPNVTGGPALKAAIERAGYEVAGVSEPEVADGGREIRLIVPGMGSDHCAGIVSGSIKRLPGIAKVGTNIANHRVTVRFDAAQVDAARIRSAVERAGYDVAAVEEAKPSAKDHAAEGTLKSAIWHRPGSGCGSPRCRPPSS